MTFYIKIITTLIPFLWEMMFGKDANLQETFRHHKKAVVLVVGVVLSLTLNVWLAVRVLNISAKYVKLQQSSHFESKRPLAAVPKIKPDSATANIEYTQRLQSALDTLATQETQRTH